VNRREGERLAEVVRGRAVEVVAEDGSRWPTEPGGIRMADGTGAAVRQPHHPDPLVEALRWSITEGAVLQAIGRGRGVRRAVRVTLLAALALPLTVAEVAGWDEVQPDRLTVAAAEAALTGRALPLAPADLAAARADLWPSANAADHDLKRGGKGGQTLIGDSYKGLAPFAPLTAARYRKRATGGRWSVALVPSGPEADARDALEARIGALAAFELIPSPAREPEAAMPPAHPPAPAPEPAEQPGLPPAALGLKPLRPMLSPVVDSFVVHRPDGPLVLRSLRYPRRVATVLLPYPEATCRR
jgi:putative DNA primase/helicase